MKRVIINNHEKLMINFNDTCPLCQLPLKNATFSWNLFHGEANSSCCGATYQMKDYHIEKPNAEEKQLLEMLSGKWIQFKIKEEWIIPLRTAMHELQIHNINNEEVIKKAEEIFGDKK